MNSKDNSQEEAVFSTAKSLFRKMPHMKDAAENVSKVLRKSQPILCKTILYHMTNILAVAKVKELFSLLDQNSDGVISRDDINLFKEKYSQVKEKILSITTIELFSFEKSVSFSEFYRIFQEGRKMCKNYVTLYRTKLTNLENSIEKTLSELDFTNLLLVFTKIPQEKFTLKIDDSIFQGEEIVYQLTSFKDLIISYEDTCTVFKISKHFVELFITDESDFIVAMQDFPLPIIVKIRMKGSVTKIGKEKLNKIKMMLTKDFKKKVSAGEQLDYYQRILDGVTNMGDDSTEISIITSVNYLDAVLSINNDEEIPQRKQYHSSKKFLRNKIFAKQGSNNSLNQTCVQVEKENDISKQSEDEEINRSYMASTCFNSKISPNQVIQIEPVTEETAYSFIDDKLKELVKISSETEREKEPKGSLLSLLYFLSQCNSIMLGCPEFNNPSKEYLRSIKKKTGGDK